MLVVGEEIIAKNSLLFFNYKIFTKNILKNPWEKLFV